MSTSNVVTLFSNGIGDFQFTYDLPKDGKEITIPVRKEYLCDGINIAIFGATLEDEVEVMEPARFTASNVNPSPLKLEAIGDCVKSMLNALRGAQVNLVTIDDKNIKGRIVGIDQQEEDKGTFKVQSCALSIFEDGILRRVQLNTIAKYIFPQADIQREIDKVMESAYGRIGLASSIITMKLRGRNGGKCRAVLGFTVPVAAWSIEYQIRRIGEIYRLTGSAIVHNNTDQVWENALIRCVTGIPYTVATDVAEQRVPERNRINIITGKAAGGTEAHRGVEVRANNFAPVAAGGVDWNTEGNVNYKSLAPHLCGKPTSAKATAAEVGDFTVLSPRGLITIPANNSVVIEVIGTDLEECKPILLYNYTQDEEKSGRPQMALDFTNGLPHSLGRGPCNVYDGDLFQGTAIFPGAKSGEKRFILHGQDTAVEVRREGGQVGAQFSSIHVKKGVLMTTQRRRTDVAYSVRSLKDEACQLIVEHDHIIPKSEIHSGGKALETTATGVRFSIEVPAHGQAELTLTESYLEKSDVTFMSLGAEGSMRWLRTNVISTEHPSAKRSKGLEECLTIQSKIEVKDQEIQTINVRMQAIDQHQKDIRANLAAIKTAGEHMHEWENQLATNDKDIQNLRTNTIPKLRKEKEELEKDLQITLSALIVVWDE